jgi:heterotetrameric sarcosine oxidase gamma subunit
MPDSGLRRRAALGGAGMAPAAALLDRAGLRIAAEPLGVVSVRRSRLAGGPLALGFDAPGAPNGVAGDEAFACAWIEPRAWLLLGTAERCAQVVALRPDDALVTDLSHRYACFRISGARATELLSAAVSVGAQNLQPGRCVRTRFAEETDVLLQALPGAAGFRLLIDSALAHYAAAWLQDAAGLVTAGDR